MSEVNVNILDVNKRADYLEFIFRECFAHPAVKGFLFWYNYQTQDVYNQFGGQCNACLANLDYSLNPAGQRVLVSVAGQSPILRNYLDQSRKETQALLQVFSFAELSTKAYQSKPVFASMLG